MHPSTEKLGQKVFFSIEATSFYNLISNLLSWRNFDTLHLFLVYFYWEEKLSSSLIYREISLDEKICKMLNID